MPEARATSRYNRTSARKMRRSVDMIRGQHVAEAQRILLARWQCDRMQGNLCGPPAAAVDTEKLLLRQRKTTKALADDSTT